MARYGIPLLAAASSLTLVAAVLPASSAARSALRVRTQSLAPKAFTGSGGDLFLKLDVSKGRARITDVQGQAQIPGQGGGARATLVRHGSLYQGTIHVPANYQSVQVRASVNVYVTSTDGTEPTYFLATVPV